VCPEIGKGRVTRNPSSQGVLFHSLVPTKERKSPSHIFCQLLIFTFALPRMDGPQVGGRAKKLSSNQHKPQRRHRRDRSGLRPSSLLLYHYALQRAGKRGAFSVHVGDDSSETLCIVQTQHIMSENGCEFFFSLPEYGEGRVVHPPSTTEACDAIRVAFLLARKPLHRPPPPSSQRLEGVPYHSWRCLVSYCLCASARGITTNVAGINVDSGRFLLPWDPNA